MSLELGTIVRLEQPGYGYRVWEVTGVALGGVGQESVYLMRVLDMHDPTTGEEMTIPCCIVDKMVADSASS